jgi:hypothetical protein
VGLRRKQVRTSGMTYKRVNRVAERQDSCRAESEIDSCVEKDRQITKDREK